MLLLKTHTQTHTHIYVYMCVYIGITFTQKMSNDPQGAVTPAL